MNSQIAIPCYLMRGGTSKGPFFLESDLPQDETLRNKLLLAIMGSPHKMQIDGLGGAHPLTSKVGIVNKSDIAGVDLEFLFAQLQPNTDKVDVTPNCGNMLSAVVPFALERGILKAKGEVSTYRVLTRNTGMSCDITVNTPSGIIKYAGDTHIDGAPGGGSPIKINFLDTAGSICIGLLPTGNPIDKIAGINVTCIDNGMPVVILRADDVGCTGYETVSDLNQNQPLKDILENLRLEASIKMGLGNTKDKNYPKMCLVSKPSHGGTISTRCFIPHVCHEAIGVLAAVTIATACITENSVCSKIVNSLHSASKKISVEHPTGEFTLEITPDTNNPQNSNASLLRTARLLMRGEVMLPKSLFQHRKTSLS